MNTSIIRGMTIVALSMAPAASFALLPQSSGATAASTVAPRAAAGGRMARCIGCTDSARTRQQMLINKLDSLRWEFTNRRMTRPEQETFAREMDATVAALQQMMESSGGARVRLVPSHAETIVGSGAAAGAAEAYTIVVTRRGYLGVTFDGPSIGYPPERPEVIRFLQYPKIASVDPASPAERAGLIIGDTLVAMNGTDVVENSIDLTKMLVPDEKMSLKVRRDGDAKEFRVIVGAAPATIARRLTPMPPMPPGGVVVFGVPVAPMAPAAQGAPSVRAEVGARSPRSAEIPSPAAAPAAQIYWDSPPQGGVFVTGRPALAGARIETVTEGLGRALGVKEGVLVTQTPPGSPAYLSGLRDGDVIVAADGATITTTRQLLNVDRENGVKLVIVRDKKKQDLTLRWK